MKTETEKRDYLVEAIRIINGTSRMLPEVRHLHAIWMADEEDVKLAQERAKEKHARV